VSNASSTSTPADAERAKLCDELPLALWVARAPGGELVYANGSFAEILGTAARADVVAGDCAEPYRLHTTSGELCPKDELPFSRAVRERATVSVDGLVVHRSDGMRAHLRAHARPMFAGDTITQVVMTFADITREVELRAAQTEHENRAHRAQKMESIGKLAGGIAHDFNNLLAAIRVIAGTLRRGERDTFRIECLDQIEQAAESGVQLTRSLLGFARRGKNLAARVSLNDVVVATSNLAQRSGARAVQVKQQVRATRDVVADHSQLEQLVMNLLVNAREALTDGTGRVVVRTYDADVDADTALRLRDLSAGPHVVLEVEDEGPGIDPGIRDRIFEPYFTTKVGGTVRGMGLGLATVFGIVENHGGSIEVLDAAPHGTIMRVYFRAADRDRPRAAPPRVRRAPKPRKGTVLLVDDEKVVRTATTVALRSLGYEVLAVEDGAAAIATYRERASGIVAVLLDMVMPRMDGRATYLALRDIDPEVPVLLTTGFALNEEAQRILDLGVRGFLAKPFDLTALAEALEDVRRDGARASVR
jgi:signal transduction histidine kinase/CheY-like chemotaxis protein